MLSIPIQHVPQVQPLSRGLQFVRQPDYQRSTVASDTTRKSAKQVNESGVWRVISANPAQPDYAESSLPLITKSEVAHSVVRPAIDRSLLAHIIFIEHTGQPLLPPPILRSSTYKPRTRLGKRLWGLRLQVAASGARLLDWDDIEQEVTERRESARAAQK
jgi:hypothetical protein